MVAGNRHVEPSACRRSTLEIFFRLPRALPVPRKKAADKAAKG